MSETARRRGLLGISEGEPNPKFTSSKGKTYFKRHTVEIGGLTIAGWLDSMGQMPEMTELTFTGYTKYANASNNIGILINGTLTWSSYVPNLERLIINPTSTGLSTKLFSVGHYAFTGLQKCTFLQLGGLKDDGYCYFNGGGYFRNDNDVKTVGTAAGLELVVYSTAYHVRGGFNNGTKAASTTITQYNWETGEVLTA